MIYIYIFSRVHSSFMLKNLMICDSLKNNYFCSTMTAKEYKHLIAGVVVVTFSTFLEDSYLWIKINRYWLICYFKEWCQLMAETEINNTFIKSKKKKQTSVKGSYKCTFVNLFFIILSNIVNREIFVHTLSTPIVIGQISDCVNFFNFLEEKHKHVYV